MCLFSTFGAQFTSSKVRLWGQNRLRTLRVLQLKKTVNATAARGHVLSTCSLVPGGFVDFMVFHNLRYSRPRVWSSGSKHGGQNHGCGCGGVHGSKIEPLKPIEFYRFIIFATLLERYAG